MKYITKFRIYFSAITFILFSCLGVFLLKYFNPRNAETIEITANSYLANADVLSKIKIFRLTVNDEILEIAKDEKLNDSVFVFRSDKVFIKKILISLPDSLVSEPLSFQIKVGNKNFCFANQHISKSWLAFKPHNVNIDNVKIS